MVSVEPAELVVDLFVSHRAEVASERRHFDRWIDAAQPIRDRIDFEAADVCLLESLPTQIGFRDGVDVEQIEFANSATSKIGNQVRRSSGANQHHDGGEQPHDIGCPFDS